MKDILIVIKDQADRRIDDTGGKNHAARDVDLSRTRLLHVAQIRIRRAMNKTLVL